MSVGLPFALLEEAGATLSLLEDAVPRTAFLNLYLVSATYVSTLMGSMVSSTLSLSREIQDIQDEWVMGDDAEAFIEMCRARHGFLDLFLADPDPSHPVPPPHLLLPWMGTCTRRYLDMVTWQRQKQ